MRVASHNASVCVLRHMPRRSDSGALSYTTRPVSNQGARSRERTIRAVRSFLNDGGAHVNGLPRMRWGAKRADESGTDPTTFTRPRTVDYVQLSLPRNAEALGATGKPGSMESLREAVWLGDQPDHRSVGHRELRRAPVRSFPIPNADSCTALYSRPGSTHATPHVVGARPAATRLKNRSLWAPLRNLGRSRKCTTEHRSRLDCISTNDKEQA
jgi:hypothetical protein